MRIISFSRRSIPPKAKNGSRCSSSTLSTAAFRLTFGTGTTAEIEEERRLLYVAMTRAKDDLHLIVPQRFFTHGQSAQGDRHVYASRTRFIPNGLVGLFEKAAWPAMTASSAAPVTRQGARIDIGARMRKMWQ